VPRSPPTSGTAPHGFAHHEYGRLSRFAAQRSAPAGHWLRLKMVGHKSNRDGFGAQVEITAAVLSSTPSPD